MANKRLYQAAQIALTDYLALSRDEYLMVLSDEPMRDIGLAIFEAGKEIALEAIYVEMSPRQFDGNEPPEQVATIMKNMDVVVAPTSRSITHTLAKREASLQGVRVATMPGIKANSLIRCLSADPKEIIALNDKLSNLLDKTDNVRVTTELGTEITLPIKGRRILSSSGVLKNIGESGNLPSGEVFTAPLEGRANGVIMVDGSMSGIGILDEPVRLTVRDGFVIRIAGNEAAYRLKELLKKVGKEAYAIAEFGIGTNPKAKLSGDILEDEKVLGTCHIALGNNISMGGSINVPGHFDGIIKEPTIYFDNKIIMENGKLLI